MTTREALAVLGLHGRVTRTEVRTAYLDLVKVWHPDRFGGDTRLQAKAQAQLQAINAAYDFLSGTGEERHRPPPSPKPPAPEPPPPQPASRHHAPPSAAPEPQETPDEPASASAVNSQWFGLAVLVAVLALLVGAQLGIQNVKPPLRVISSEPPRAAPPGPSTRPANTAGKNPPVSSDERWFHVDEIELDESPPPDRPANGETLKSAVSRGLGLLRVTNGTKSDAAVFLSPVDSSDEHVIYVHGGDTAVISQVSPRRYRLRFMLGSDWTGEAFGRADGYSEFERDVVFRETESETAHRYDEMAVTLNAVPHGNARTKRVAPFRLQAP